MRIRVALLGSGQVREIEASEFDASKHLRLAEEGSGDEPALVPDDAGAGTQAATAVTREDVAGIVAGLRGGLTEDDQTRIQTEVDRRLDQLREPNRTHLDAIEGGHTRVPGHEAIVSRNQPTDILYRRVINRNPDLAMWRSAEQDHHAAQWIIGMAANNASQMFTARDKLIDVNKKVLERWARSELHSRATSLEGDLDTSDPTAILDGTGGHLLPQNVNAIVQIARDLMAVLPGLCMPLQMTSGTLRVPTSGAATAAMVAEGGTPSQGEPTFASGMLTPHKAQVFMKASLELIADSAFNVVQIYGLRAGTALGALEDVQIATSDGVTPNVTEALAGGNVDEATTTVLVYEDLVSLFLSPAQVYRTGPSVAWAAGAVVIALLGQLMDGNDHPILSMPGPVAPIQNAPGSTQPMAGAVGTIFGRPVVEAPFAAGTLVFGDFNSYGFARREQITATNSTHADFATDLVQFKFTERFDGRIIDDVGLKQMAALATVA